ncbi:hypothetical protein BON22_2819 [Cyberlindnera fabianii]|uniref:DUF1776-domain-containing protein n=1 Tax=Cyberlindnera fabianii TaxID=36022 RepID=A0A1V2L6Y1_CYBFA|nr:hypothetical protein BON22_2819 [Cyberlindnera fabianii]
MDPVDRTFDTVYYWSQRAKLAAQAATDKVVSTTSSVADSISTAISSSSPDSPSPYISSRASTSSFWSSLGLNGPLAKSVRRNKFATAATVVALLGLSGYVLKSLYPAVVRSRGGVKRRAERLANGARKDVILIVGSVTEPLTRYIAHDLEARGFIVYITSTNSKADQKFFQNESLQDIKSLIVSSDSRDTEFNTEQIHKFDYLLSSDHIPFQGAQPNKLNLVGIIFVPDMYFQAGKFHLVPSSTWNQTINERALMPLNLLMAGVIGMAEKYDSNIIFLTPTISTSLQLPYHSLENVTINFIQQLSACLQHDYDSLNITNLRLGAVNINSNNHRKNFGIKGEPIKKLHYKIFDLLYSEDNNSVEYVGFGARLLSYFGAWIPRWITRNYFRNYFAHE